MNSHTSLEHKARQSLIETAPAEFRNRQREDFDAAIRRCRRLCADYLRVCRRTGARETARQFRRHMFFMGYPIKLNEPAEAWTRKHRAWHRRHAHLMPGFPVPELL